MKKMLVERNSFRLLGYAIKFAPVLFIFKTIWVVIKTLKTIMVDVLLLKILIDAITQDNSFYNIVIYIIFAAIVTFLEMYIDDIVNEYILPISECRIHKSVHESIFNKVLNTDLYKFDDSEFYNSYVWSLDTAEEQIVSCLNNFMKLFSSVLSIFSMISILVSADTFTILFSVVPMMFVIITGKLYNKVDIVCESKVNSVVREKNYSRRVFYLKEFSKELRYTKIGNVIMEHFLKSTKKEIQLKKQYGLRKLIITVIKDSSYGFIQMLALYLYLAYKLMIKTDITTGTCAAIINTVDRLTGYFYQLSSTVLAINKNEIYAEKFFEFLNGKNVIEENENISKCIPDFEKIELNNITFTYPNANNATLRNINLTLHKGDKIALVGINGAGKTTLIKVLMRFYDPQNGVISYNNQDIRTLPVKSYREQFSTIFQDPNLYAVSLIENITMDQINSEDEIKAKRCLCKVNLNEYDKCLYKNVTKEFDNNGLEFSGGQRQKISIARAIFNNRDIVIMDEASSALDPISENEINNLMLKELSDKTILIITHRLTTVKNVDKIYFLENGEIIEAGSHEELMGLKGKYSEMYTLQAKNYAENKW